MPVIYLARHATPDWSRKDIPYHLPPGPPLVAQGEAEAALLADYLQQQGVRLIFSSPLARCLATARIVGEIYGATVVIDQRLIEIQPDEEQSVILARLQPVFEQASQVGAPDGAACLLTHGGPVSILLSWLGMDDLRLQECRIYDSHNPLPPAGAWQVSQEAPGEAWRLRLAFVPVL